MSLALDILVSEARALANDHPCEIEHIWEAIGGRACPRGSENCSQAVYQCARCGEHDYGYPGGPGAADCETPCSFLCELADSAREEG